MLDEARIKKLQALYKKHFNKEITREEAFEKGSELIRLVQIIYRPMTEERWDQVQKRLKELDNL